MKKHNWKAGDVGINKSGNIFLVVDNNREWQGGQKTPSDEPQHLLVYLTLDAAYGTPKACGTRWHSMNFDHPETDGVMTYLNDADAAAVKRFLFSLTDWAVENYKELTELADETNEVK